MAMGKRAAQELAREQRITWGELHQLVVAPRDRSAVCPINPQLTMGYCQDLYAAVAGSHESSHVPDPWRQDVYSSRAGAVKPSADFLTVSNILRIFGPPVA